MLASSWLSPTIRTIAKKYYLRDMKKLFAFFTVLLLFVSPVFAQHVIYLKSGEQLKGQLVGGNSDSIYFKFMGNRLSLAHSDLSAVYFNLQAAPDAIADPDADKDASIHGYVIESLELQNVQRSAAGAQVFVVPVVDAGSFNMSLLQDSLPMIISLRDIFTQFASNGAPVPENVVAEMNKYNCRTDAEFEQYCRRANHNLSLLKNASTAVKLTADAQGEYTLKVRAGAYYVLAVSKRYKGNNSAEVAGIYNVQRVQVASEEDLVVTSKIEIYRQE